MAVKHEITLYDVRSTLNPPAWSPNVWKIRFILNYKRLAYTTCWLSYPDIGDVLSAVGVPPTRTQKPFYTVPSIMDQTDGMHIALSESTNIAIYLEKARPLPSIFPEGDPIVQFDYIDFIEEHIYTPMIYMTVPSTTRILEGRDLEYYLASRKGFLGIALEDMFPQHKQQAIWHDLEGGLDRLATLIDHLPRRGRRRRWLLSMDEGPGYADFVLGAIFYWFEKAGPVGAWDRIRYRNGGKWERLVQELQPFSKVL
ncbi:hypothetical protein DAEQUDRAFT_678990 [Daedalea quercina L-15889]|uniref:GST N-terminal domain-containing protein n=1 Tax=Daedalea quercina L-15889 TaxID=1314783 RepID=A0A165LBR5_9APHY|nr:hypothetical protein DAEQUDRAFT_678990 [Daedalea quercina L-15889]